jgi:hypothetical protein
MMNDDEIAAWCAWHPGLQAAYHGCSAWWLVNVHALLLLNKHG